MSHEEAVKRIIAQQLGQSEQHEKLWHEIAAAYQEGGENAIQSILIGHSENINKEFGQLLQQLRTKL